MLLTTQLLVFSLNTLSYLCVLIFSGNILNNLLNLCKKLSSETFNLQWGIFRHNFLSPLHTEDWNWSLENINVGVFMSSILAHIIRVVYAPYWWTDSELVYLRRLSVAISFASSSLGSWSLSTLFCKICSLLQSSLVKVILFASCSQ